MEDIKLDYGDQVAMNTTPKLYIHVTNKTAITAAYSFCMENFYSKPPTPPDQKKSDMSRNLR